MLNINLHILCFVNAMSSLVSHWCCCCSKRSCRHWQILDRLQLGHWMVEAIRRDWKISRCCTWLQSDKRCGGRFVTAYRSVTGSG